MPLPPPSDRSTGSERASSLCELRRRGCRPKPGAGPCGSAVDDSRNTLVLLTQAYPFGRKSETFLDAELPDPGAQLRPGHRRAVGSRRPRPRRCLAGVRCETFLADASRKHALLELAPQPRRSALQYGRAVADGGLGEGIPAPSEEPTSALSAGTLLKYKLLKEFVHREGLQRAVFYDYWLENSTLALSWLRREGVLDRAVARAHGFDVYDDRWAAGIGALRSFKLGLARPGLHDQRPRPRIPGRQASGRAFEAEPVQAGSRGAAAEAADRRGRAPDRELREPAPLEARRDAAGSPGRNRPAAAAGSISATGPSMGASSARRGCCRTA